MRLGPAQLVVRTVCVHNHSGIFEQPQTATTTPMGGHELDTHSIDTRAVAGHRMGYHEYVHGAYYGLKYRASQKRYLVTVLAPRAAATHVKGSRTPVTAVPDGRVARGPGTALYENATFFR